MYIPASLSIGGAVGWLQSMKPTLTKRWPILILILSMIGGYLRLDDLDPQKYSLGTRPDVHAMDWIKNNTPPDAIFLTNAFFAYGGGLVGGSDAGWWLSNLTSRQTTLPPINYGTEVGPINGYRQWVNQIYRDLKSYPMDDLAFRHSIVDRGISHIYIGQQQGSVNNGGTSALAPGQLVMSENYKEVYHSDRVWIFEVIP